MRVHHPSVRWFGKKAHSLLGQVRGTSFKAKCQIRLIGRQARKVVSILFLSSRIVRNPLFGWRKNPMISSSSNWISFSGNYHPLTIVLIIMIIMVRCLLLIWVRRRSFITDYRVRPGEVRTAINFMPNSSTTETQQRNSFIHEFLLKLTHSDSVNEWLCKIISKTEACIAASCTRCV